MGVRVLRLFLSLPLTLLAPTAQRVTNETYRTVTDARFHPSGSKVIATKWYTSERSLGAGEGWEYPVPSIESQDKNAIEAGSGFRLVGRSLPPGWTAENYGDQQIGPEQFIWSGNDTLIFSKNVVDESEFSYSKGKSLYMSNPLCSHTPRRHTQGNLRHLLAEYHDQSYRNSGRCFTRRCQSSRTLPRWAHACIRSPLQRL